MLYVVRVWNYSVKTRVILVLYYNNTTLFKESEWGKYKISTQVDGIWYEREDVWVPRQSLKVYHPLCLPLRRYGMVYS